MSSTFDRDISILINVKASHPELLIGLDAWLKLGLISETQVKHLCREYLSCPLPQTQTISPIPPIVKPEELRKTPEKLPEKPVIPKTPKIPIGSPTKGNFITNSLQSLMAEISVRWLLFLGTFMVVVSSGVLAASQWAKFPPAGQYGILLTYTLIFWGISWWTQKQGNLKLTGQTLQWITILLIPVNFLAIDSFHLWRNPLEWLTTILAAITLTFISVLLIKNQPQASGLSLFNNLGLSYLHLGWSLPLYPVVAVYIGTIETALVSFLQYRQLSKSAVNQTQINLKSPNFPGVAIIIYALLMLLLRGIFAAGLTIGELGLAVGICGWLLAWLPQQENREKTLVSNIKNTTNSGNLPTYRSSLTAVVPNGVAAGNISDRFSVWESIGGVLILIGWLVSLKTNPAQAIAVSGIGLWFCASRLLRFWLQIDLLGIFIIGLQTIWLSWRLIPIEIQKNIIATATQITATENIPIALLSLALFPYILFMLWLTNWLHDRHQSQLAKFGEILTLLLGLNLTVLSLFSPIVRSINLAASTIILILATQRYWKLEKSPNLLASANQTARNYQYQNQSFNNQSSIPDLIFFVYLTQITAVLTIISIIDWYLPKLVLGVWAAILLFIMVVEWLLLIINFSSPIGVYRESNQHENSIINRDILTRTIRKSSWHLGLALAGLSYWLLWQNYEISNLEITIINRSAWGLLWLIVPISLTGIASCRNSLPRWQLASWLSIITLLMVQGLTLGISSTRLVSLGIAICLMLVNTQYLQNTRSAVVTIGFCLSFITALLWQGIPGFLPLSGPGWLIAIGLFISTLWLLRSWIIYHSYSLTDIYAPAIDRWGIFLFTFQSIILTLHSLTVYWNWSQANIYIILATAITMIAIVYRGWRQPSNWTIYSLGWSLEIFAAETLGFFDRSPLNLAIANIILGLIAQLLGDWWQRKTRREFPSSWHILPLLYGALGAILRWNIFTSWTGLTTLSLALIAIGVGRRQAIFKPLIYLALIGISFSAYEILFYQLSQIKTGAIGDGLIAMATLGTTIMYAYRILTPWLINYIGLTRNELKAAAHCHWVWSSLLLMATIITPVEYNQFLGLGTGLFLVRYAIYQGRIDTNFESLAIINQEKITNINNNTWLTLPEIWVYLGLLEIVGLRIFWLNTPLKMLFSPTFLPWNAMIAVLAAAIIYILPWQKWGWIKRPFFISALLLPLLIIWENKLIVHPVALFVSAGFYILLAKLENKIRLTYISAILINWVIFRWLGNVQFTNYVWYVTPLGLTLLYIAQVDRYLKQTHQKPLRHIVRFLGSSIICVAALLTNQWLLAGIFSVLAIFIGLAFKIRAFLYVGTATFLLNGVIQGLILNANYGFFKWLTGIIVGSIFIWIAANFETQREQINALVRNWINELEEWE